MPEKFEKGTLVIINNEFYSNKRERVVVDKGRTVVVHVKGKSLEFDKKEVEVVK